MNIVLLILHRIWLLIYAPILVLGTLLGTIMLFVLKLLLGARRANGIVGPLWARSLASLLPMHVTVSGAENLDPKQAYIVVANHLSQLDIFVIYGWAGLDLRWVVKQELRNIPLIGWGCRMAGHVFVDRTNRDAAVTAINAVADELEAGQGMMFFPEGTRSKSGQLLAFKNGAFRTALQLDLPILPITIMGTYSLLPPNTILPRFGKVDLHIHQAIKTEHLSASEPNNITLVRRLARAEISSVLDDVE